MTMAGEVTGDTHNACKCSLVNGGLRRVCWQALACIYWVEGCQMDSQPAQNSGTESTRQRIIAAALRLFGEQGYSRTSTRAIAAEAGVNEVTLFRHFGSKKNLLMACVDAFNEGGFAVNFECHLTGDYAQDIPIMARLQMRDMAERFEMLRLLLCDAPAVPEVQAGLLAGARQNAERLVAYFRQQVEQGQVNPDLDPAVLAHAFDSLFSSYVFFQHLFQGVTSQEALDLMADQLARIFLRGTIRSEG